jgi:superfamily II DNA/RNA helicase
MRPEYKSNRLLGVTQSKAKMIEYNVPEQYQNIDLTIDPAKLFTLSIGLLGDLAAEINRENIEPDKLNNLRKELLFSAHFFDAYIQSKLNESLDPYMILLGSASYYLCDLPGSSKVLAKRIDRDCPDLNGGGLENLLHWLLKGDLSTYFGPTKGLFGDQIHSISLRLVQFFKEGAGMNNLIQLAKQIRKTVYEYGTPRQLLFIDVIAAVLVKKIQNSTWNALPLYSGLSRDKWLQTLQKETFIKELWPAQHLLGQADVLKGESAVVQMPTSAGKTKATELIIRSAFLAERTSLAVIIAPFRALCHEIKNSFVSAFHNEAIKVDELSDTMQEDFEITEILSHQQVLVVTPEKFLYVIRHTPELASSIGLIIFDEGHQFDSGTRGITYELLLTSLRSILSGGAQKVLISAVIINAEAIGEWLNGNSNVVSGTNLNPTFRSIGFTSWIDQLGRIEYVSSEDTEEGEFFVPRVIESYEHEKKPREIKRRLFPEKSDGQAIALYLGLKLVSNGSVAIFCGRRSTATNICEKAVENIERGIPFSLPREFSDPIEIEKLYYLHIQNLGSEASASKSSKYGIFSHHGNTPHGIRMAVEHSMREGLIRFVVCTSTLAQGVNMPIRYLIVTSVYQGLERIKVRDFHNLIGRAGRAGMHTEGSILFADPIVYDKRKNILNKWRWEQVKELLDPNKSEPCVSSLLSIFDPIKSDDSKFKIISEALEFATEYINNPDEIFKLAVAIASLNGDKGFSIAGVEHQVLQKINLITSIESFLMTYWETAGESQTGIDTSRLAEETLAFFLADKTKKEQIRELFQLLAKNIFAKISDPNRRKVYGRTLYGVSDAQSIENWIKSNIVQLLAAVNENEILKLIWPLLTLYIHNGVFRKFDNQEVLLEITQLWTEGQPFHFLLETIQERKSKLIWGKRYRDFKIEHVVEVCEGGLAYDGALIINAIIEIIELVNPEGNDELINRLQLFQKKLKYGLSDELTISIYELGFTDRVIANEISKVISSNPNKKDVLYGLRSNSKKVDSILKKYPTYYSEVFKHIVE